MRFPQDMVASVTAYDMGPGCGAVLSGPFRDGPADGRYQLRVFNGAQMASTTVSKEQFAELWFFVRSQFPESSCDVGSDVPGGGAA